MRAKPNTSSEILAFIPYNTQLQPDRVTENGWYRYPNVNRVLDSLGNHEDDPYFNRPGWLHLAYLNLEGTCGQICKQSEDGWTIECPSP